MLHWDIISSVCAVYSSCNCTVWHPDNHMFVIFDLVWWTLCFLRNIFLYQEDNQFNAPLDCVGDWFGTKEIKTKQKIKNVESVPFTKLKRTLFFVCVQITFWTWTLEPDINHELSFKIFLQCSIFVIVTFCVLIPMFFYEFMKTMYRRWRILVKAKNSTTKQ